MVAYVILTRQQTTDQSELDVYAKMAPAAREGHAMTALAFYGRHETLEGDPIEGAVVLEFPSIDAAKAWYTSPVYQEAVKHRFAGARYNAFIVEGVA